MLGQTSFATTSCASSIAPLGVSEGARPPLVGSSTLISAAPVPSETRMMTVASRASDRVKAAPSPSRSAAASPSPGKPRGEAAEALAFDRMYEHVMREEQTFVSELDKFLLLHEQVKFKKCKELHAEYEHEVRDKIQSQVDKKVSARHIKDTRKTRRQLMQDYIDTSNRKGGVLYRDIIIESEYDPLSAHNNPITFNPKVERDPCKLELRMHAEPLSEARPPPEFSKLGQPQPRMDVKYWDHMDATPYGRMGRLAPDLVRFCRYRVCSLARITLTPSHLALVSPACCSHRTPNLTSTRPA